MSMLTRYKKAGGIMELVKLIEESAEPKRSQLMSMIVAEDAEFASQVQAKIYTYEKLRALPEGIIAEVINVSAPKFIALAVTGETEDFIKLVERCLGKNFAEYKSEREILAEKPPTDSQVETARRKLLSETRKLEKEGVVKLPGSTDIPGTGTPVDMQRMPPAPNASFVNAPAGTGAAAAPVAPGGAAQFEANDGSGMPPIKNFGIEAPPPGLSGERFETFIKNLLGK